MRGATALPVETHDRSEFLLTRPMRGATYTTHADIDALNISTHTPHAGRDDGQRLSGGVHEISTHTPHAGRDN